MVLGNQPVFLRRSLRIARLVHKELFEKQLLLLLTKVKLLSDKVSLKRHKWINQRIHFSLHTATYMHNLQELDTVI